MANKDVGNIYKRSEHNFTKIKSIQTDVGKLYSWENI